MSWLIVITPAFFFFCVRCLFAAVFLLISWSEILCHKAKLIILHFVTGQSWKMSLGDMSHQTGVGRICLNIFVVPVFS